MEFKAEDNCLAHTIIIVIAKVENNTNYKVYRLGSKIRPVVRNLLVTTVIELSGGGESLNSSDFKKIYGIIR